MAVFHEATITPLQILPSFYLFREFCTGDNVGVRQLVSRALSSYKVNWLQDNLQSVCIFLPANALNFLMIPPHLRAPFATATGTIWAVLLSLSRGKSRSHEPC